MPQVMNDKNQPTGDSVDAEVQPVPREQFAALLAQEHALSEAYLRLRQIIGAMDPPTGSDAPALWAYVEGVARERMAQAAQQGAPGAVVADAENERQTLAMMLRKCAHALKIRGREDLAADVTGLLRRYGLLGSPLRTDDGASQPAPVPVPAEPPLPDPALDWPVMLLLLNEYAMHVHDASEHQAESRADISKTAALKTLERIRMAIAAHNSRWKALAHQLIFAAATPAQAPAEPLNGIGRTMFHDEGAIAQCGHCKRYTLDHRALTDRQPVCDCGMQTYWSGSFKRPGPDAQWFGKAPKAAAPAAPVVQQPSKDREATWWALVQGAAASLEDAAHCLRDPDAKRSAEGAAKHYRKASRAMWAESAALAAPQAPVVRALTDADIDNLRGLDTAQRVRFYEHDFYVLSNFSAFSIKWQGRRFPTSEHAYHWEKFAPNTRDEKGLYVRDCILFDAYSAHDAFKMAERWKPLRRPEWDAVKVDTMRGILRAKAAQHEYVRRKLLETGDRELVEDSWRDDFWGWGPNRDGKNMLGRLWMEVRAELRAGGITAGDTTGGGNG